MLWTIDGSLIVDASGHPVICDECPCGGEQECSERLDARRLELLSDPRYRFVQEATAHYHCQEQSDSESYDAGTLVVLMARDETFATPYLYAVHAYEFEEIATGTHRAIACLCSCGSDWTYVEANTYGIAMVVEADDSQECRPADMCEVYKGEIDYFASWHGGQVYGEGFYDWVSDGSFEYRSFRKAVVFEPEESDSTAPTTQRLATIECQCTGRASGRWKGGEIAVHEVDGFCDDPCQDLLVLREQALANGWTWHDSGYILTYAYWTEQDEETWETTVHVCDTYREIDMACMGCADDGQNFHFVPCGCWGIEVRSKSDLSYWVMEGSGTYSDFATYLDYPHACSCGSRAYRELYLQYPDVFGILQLGFSSDQKVRYTVTSHDPIEDTTTTSTAVTTVGRMFGYDDDYIDYRTLVCVRLRCQGGWRLCAYNTDNSRWGSQCWDYPNSQPVLLGTREPFGTDPDMTYGAERNGHVIAWWMGPSESFEQCFDNAQDAQYYYDQWCTHPTPPTPCGIRDYFQGHHASLLEPEVGLDYETGGVREVVHQEEWEDPDGGIHVDTWSEWCVTPDRWVPNGGFRGYYGTAVYYVNWIYTNRGIMVNGLSDDEQYPQYLDVYGIYDYNGDSCFGHSGVPEYGTRLTCQWCDTDFHWCDPDFELPDDSDSGSESIGE